MFHLKLAFKDTVLDNFVYLKIIQVTLGIKLLTALNLLLFHLHLLLTLVQIEALQVNQML